MFTEHSCQFVMIQRILQLMLDDLIPKDVILTLNIHYDVKLQQNPSYLELLSNRHLSQEILLYFQIEFLQLKLKTAIGTVRVGIFL